MANQPQIIPELEDDDEELDLEDMIAVRGVGASPQQPEFVDYVSDEAFRKNHPGALRALLGGLQTPPGVRPYALVAVRNPLARKVTYVHSSGLPPDAFPKNSNGTTACRYKNCDLRIRFEWSRGAVLLVPQIVLSGIWIIREIDGVAQIVGGGAHHLVLAKGRTPELYGALRDDADELFALPTKGAGP